MTRKADARFRKTLHGRLMALGRRQRNLERKRNRLARELLSPTGVFRPKIVVSTRIYRRRPKHPGRAWEQALA